MPTGHLRRWDDRSPRGSRADRPNCQVTGRVRRSLRPSRTCPVRGRADRSFPSVLVYDRCALVRVTGSEVLVPSSFHPFNGILSC